MKGYKTLGYAASTLIAVLTLPEIQAVIQEYPVASVIVNSFIIGILRLVTATPLFNKQPREKKNVTKKIYTK